jgi:AcrR family transcriptional regulator
VADTRDQLLAAAREVLHKRGIMGATTREIARAAGCADGTLYNHFDSREQLFLALFELALPAWRQALRDLPLRIGDGPLPAIIEDTLVSALAFFRDVVPIFAAVISDPALLEGYRAQLRADGRGPHRAYVALEKYLLAEQRLGRLVAAFDAATAAQQLVAASFFAAFTERFLGEAPTAANDRKWAAAQVKLLIVPALTKPTPPKARKPR